MSIILSKKLIKVMDSVYMHWCPACNERHAFHTTPQEGSKSKWTFDGNVENPTFHPSMLINRNPHFYDVLDKNARAIYRCHYWLQKGKITYCNDSTHSMSGMTVDLPEHFT